MSPFGGLRDNKHPFPHRAMPCRDSQVAQWSRIHLPMQEMQETWVPSLGREDPLEEEMATHCNIPAWRIPRTEESGGLQSMGSQKSQARLSN